MSRRRYFEEQRSGGGAIIYKFQINDQKYVFMFSNR